MADAVAHHQIISMQQEIVDHDLVECLLLYFYVGCLVLDNHPRTQGLVVKNRVAAQPLVAHMQLQLVGQKSLRVALVLDEEVREVLAHPLLRRQGDVLAAQEVENKLLFVAFPNIYFVFW